MKNIWGIDLGGTKTEAVVLDSTDNLSVVARERIETKRENGYDYILDRIKELIEKVARDLNEYPEIIGIGTPGSTDQKSGLLKNSNSTALNHKPLFSDLGLKLNAKVEMANDANCFALAEFKMGAVKKHFPDANSTFGVIMGTGVGGGIVIDSKVINGRHGIGGEWGHNFMDESGGNCYCGKVGCVETVISGPALEAFYASLTGSNKSLKQIYELAKSHSESEAVETLNRLTHFFGLGLSVVANIVDPDVFVIGGGVGNIDSIYTDGVESLKAHVFNTSYDTPVLKPELGDSAGVFGAALLTLGA